MRKLDFSKILFRLVVGTFAIVLGAALVAPVVAQVPNQGGLLFSDNFDTINPIVDLNTDITLSSRVGGALTGIQYDTTNAVGTWTLDGTRLNVVGTPYADINTSRVGLNYNFNSVSTGGMKISYDFQALSNDASWAGMIFGSDSSALPPWGSAANYADVITFDNTSAGVNWYTGTYCLNDTNGPLYQSGNTGVVFNDAMHHVDVILTDMRDGTFANGAGTFSVDYYIDGKCVMSSWDQWDGADFVNNYIGFMQAAAAAGDMFVFDNLKIYGNDVLLDTSNQWQSLDYNANWTAPASWTVSVPNARGANALILANNAVPGVNVDQDIVIGSLCLRNNGTTISSSSANKITFWANEGANSQLQVLRSSNDISVPIELKNDLDITVTPGVILNLYGSVTAPDGPVNVCITPASGGYPGGVPGADAGGNINISSTFNPGGTFNIFGGTVNVQYGGSLTASSVYLGDRKYWNALQIAAGASLTTDLVAGDGSLHINGGTFAGATHKPTLDLRALVLGGGSTYTIDPDETITCAEILGNGDAWNSLTFDGGTMKVRPDPYGPYGANYGLIGYGGQELGYLYVTDKGANIDLNGNSIVVASPFLDALEFPGSAGPVTVSNGGQLSITDSPDFTGGWIFKNIDECYAGSGATFGTGSVQVLDGASVTYETIVGAHISVPTNFFLQGPAKATYYNTLFVDWPGAVDFTGTIDVSDAETYPAGDQRNLTTIGTHSHAISTQCYMNIAGPITGTGGVQFGKDVNVGAVANGLVYLSGSQPNTFEGPAVVTCQEVILQKDPGVVAIPHDMVIAPIVLGAGFMLGADDQTSPTGTVIRFTSATADRWGDFSLNGHATTIRGLVAPVGGLSVIENINLAPNGMGMADLAIAPTTVGTLTVNPQAGDDFSFAGVIADAVHVWAGLDPATVPAVALVKTGEGTQRLTASYWQYGYFLFTGGTTVKAGVLDISSVNSFFDEANPAAGIQLGFTPNSSITLEAGTLLASGLLQNTITRGTTTSGTLEAGGTAYLVLDVNKAVDIAAAVIDPGHTLSLTSGGTNTIDDISGSSGTLVVTGDTVLVSNSINVDTLQIGGVAPVAYVVVPPPGNSAPVPEPSAMLLLAIAGALIAWFRLRK